MNNLLLLWICLVLSSCATDPTPATVTDEPAETVMKTQTPALDMLKIGMTRSEAEHLLGEPTSITETAAGTTAVWVFHAGAATATPPESGNNSGLFSQIGSIAATVAGIFSPIAGVATSVGSQVYSVSTAANDDDATQIDSNMTRIIKLEFKDDRVYSIQRAKPTLAGSSTAP